MKSKPKKQPVKDRLASLLDNIYECESDHPFLIANGLEGAQCLTYSGDTEIAGVDLNGSIVAKIYDIHSEFVNALLNVQAGDGTFEVVLIPGAQIAGCYARIGKMGQTYLVVEDLRCALALNLATGMGVVVTLTSENLLPVCQALRTKHPEKTMIVCGGDYGNMAGRRSTDAVNSVARKVGALVAFPLREDTFLDYYRKHGPDALIELIAERNEPEELFEFGKKEDKSGIPEEPSDWSSPVNGQALFAEVLELLISYLSFQEGAAIAVTLWIFLTHTIEVARVAPILTITSPVPQCGKTTLLGLLLRLTFRPMTSANLTAAVLFRTVDTWAPTLLVDEADTFLQNSTELNGIFNSGHTRETAYVHRMGRGNKPERFSTFCAKAVAMIGSPSDTMRGRSVVIQQQRKLEEEVKRTLLPRKNVEIASTRARIARWSKDNLSRIEAAEFDRPKLGNDRAADNWEPLLAIAQALGPDCFDAAMEAATLLSRKHALVRCTSEDLLRDIKAVFDTTKAKRLTTVRLIEQLCTDDDSPWREFNKGRAITSTELARLLRAFEIESINLRISDSEIRKGYKLEHFADAFSRYVPSSRK
jgi:putative DNA primase/helicase